MAVKSHVNYKMTYYTNYKLVIGEPEENKK